MLVFLKQRFTQAFIVLSMLAFISLSVPYIHASSTAPQNAEVWLEQNPVDGLALSGPLVQGGLLLGQIDPASKLTANGKPVYVDESGKFVIGFGRDEKKVFQLGIETDGAAKQIELPVQQRAYDIQRIEGVKKKYVEPDPEQVKRSRRDTRRVVAARKSSSNDKRFMEGFDWPSIGPISGVFGSQRVYNGKPRRPHYGVDIAREIGAPVVAPAAGVVTLAEDLYFSGWTLIIDHGHYLSSTFLHLDKIHVEVGNKVEQGQRIADIGDTGRVTGPHLDWRMNWTGGGTNARIDPQLLVPPMPEQLPEQSQQPSVESVDLQELETK